MPDRDDPTLPAVDERSWSADLKAAAATGDPLALVAFWSSSAEMVDGKLRAAVRAARATGCSWQQVGDALGTSRQSAWERYKGDEAPVRGKLPEI